MKGQTKMKNVKKANIVSEPKPLDATSVLHKDRSLHYVWGRKNDEMEMSDFYAKQYVPASGKEEIMRNPFEKVKDMEGEVKVRGNRILMCCPKGIVNARRKAKAARRQPIDKSVKADARKLMHGQTGFKIESEASEKTVRESIKE